MDMLVAVLNCCTKEELDELEDELPGSTTAASGEPVQTAEEILERRKVIKNKILAVGRMSRVFALLREESERVSELKSISGSTKLPYGTLALGAEGIKEAITGFDDAYVTLTKSGSGILRFCIDGGLISRTNVCHQTWWILNQRRARRCSPAQLRCPPLLN